MANPSMKKHGIGMMKILERKNARLWIPGGKQKQAVCLISNLAGVTPAKPSWATLPMPGVQPVLVDENGKEVTEKDENGLLKGNLCIKAPWPGIIQNNLW